MPPRARHALALAVLATQACSAPSPAPALPTRLPPSPPPAFLAPARYLAVSPTWVERTAEGLDHVIAGGRRLAVRRFDIAHTAPALPEVEGGARAPAWMPARYVFWKGKHLYSAPTFTGDLTPLATLPAAPIGSFDWIDGIGLRFANGAMVVPTSGALKPIGVPTAMAAIAVDARRAIAVTAFGRAVITTNGGASFREADELRGAGAIEIKGDEIAVTMPNGRERFVTASGAIVEGGAGHVAGLVRGRRPVEEPETFPGGSATHAIDIALRNGLPTRDEGVVVADEEIVGRLDPASLRMTSIASIAGLGASDCVAFRAADAPLLACADDTRATIVDIEGAPRIERTFDLTGAPERVRFVGADGDAIGYVGPCEGPAAASRELSANSEPMGFPREQSAAFCVRAGRDTWVEHRLDPVDASDVLAWIPRAGGGAAAIVARIGPMLPDHERVTVRGALRVVRIARSEPPFSLTSYGWDSVATLDRSLRIGADDTIDGWFFTNAGATNVTAIRIDALGHARAWPAPPHAGMIFHAGKLALTRGEDGKLWETIDGGHVWTEVDPPPSDDARPSSCSPIGCAMGSFVRLGWTAPEARISSAPARPRTPPPRAAIAPLLRLACAFDGPVESKRATEGEGFGVAPSPQQRSPLARIGTLGAAAIPYTGPNVPVSGSMDIGWVAPLDTSGAIHRVSLPVSMLGATSTNYRGQEMRLGWLLSQDGGLDVIALGRGDRCAARALVTAGITRAIGGCADEPTVAVEIGGQSFAAHVASSSIAVSIGTAAPRARLAGSRAAKLTTQAPAASLRTRAFLPLGAPLRPLAVGIGARGGAPVIVAVDVNGDATIASIDPTSGVIGAEDRLRSLRDAAIGSDRACAPRPDDARVVIPFEGLIALDREALRGVLPAAGAGVAIVRWSRDRACLDAVELPVRDERFDDAKGSYERPGSMHKLIARLGGSMGSARAMLLSITPGTEVRQKLACTKVRAGAE